MAERARLTTPEAKAYWLECLQAAGYMYARTVLDTNAAEKTATEIADELYGEFLERCK